jgi:hypothetical protein
MRRLLLVLALVALAVTLSGGSASAATVAARNQLRGHLPELGERPTMRVFLTAAAYDSYRSSLGDANIFPASTSLSMSFDKDILALYTRGNDTGGRCIGPQISANFSGDTLTATAPWQAGTCGAPSNAHYPFILMAVSRMAADGTSWLSGARSVCFSVETADTNACATLGAASPSPSGTTSPAATTSTAPSATRSLTPSQTVAAASPTATAASASATASRSPAAAASPAGATDSGTNFLLYAMLIAIAFLVLLSLFLSRGGRRR